MFIRKVFGRVLVAAVVGGGAIGLTAGATAADGRDLRVPAKGSDVHSLTLRKGVKVTITAKGDGDTDIDLYVYDENGRLVAKDDDTTDICVVQFTPDETQKYRIEIKNLGNVYNEYTLTVK